MMFVIDKNVMAMSIVVLALLIFALRFMFALRGITFLVIAAVVFTLYLVAVSWKR